MPEGHAIGVKRGHAVIAPAAGGTGLGPRAIGHYSFALSEVIQRVAGETSGITNTGVYGAARCRIPDMATFPFASAAIAGIQRHKPSLPFVQSSC